MGDPEPIFEASDDEERVRAPVKGTCRIHSELVCHLDLIVQVAVRLIGANQGQERFWGRLRFLKELMSCGYPSNKIDEPVIQPHEFWPVSIAWFGHPTQAFEWKRFSTLVLVVEGQHFLGCRGQLEDLKHMEFGDGLIQPNSFKGLIDFSFRLTCIECKARAADGEFLLTLT